MKRIKCNKCGVYIRPNEEKTCLKCRVIIDMLKNVLVVINTSTGRKVDFDIDNIKITKQ